MGSYRRQRSLMLFLVAAVSPDYGKMLTNPQLQGKMPQRQSEEPGYLKLHIPEFYFKFIVIPFFSTGMLP